jgi:hypothetical protein
MVSSPGYIPGPLVIPGVVEVILPWQLPNGKVAHNVLHVDNPTSLNIDVPLCDTVFAAIAADARTTTYLGDISTVVQLNGVEMRDLNTALSPLFVSTAAAIPGTQAAHPIPETAALVVTLKTAVAGRSGRGRAYLTGIAVSGVDASGHADAGTTADAEAFMQGVSDALFASSLFLCVAHRAHAAYTSPNTGNLIPASGASSAGVVSIKVEDNVFDSQRRRK